MYSDTITIFNRYHSRLGDMWYPHVLQNVNLVVDKSAVTAKYGAETKDQAKLHVKYEKINGVMYVGGLPYLSPKDWNNLLNDELENNITFNYDGNYWDFFVLGDADIDEPVSDKDFVDGFFSYMESKQECYALTSVSSPYKVIPHFEIMAR